MHEAERIQNDLKRLGNPVPISAGLAARGEVTVIVNGTSYRFILKNE